MTDPQLPGIQQKVPQKPLDRLMVALRMRAMATTMSLGSIPVGIMALALGDGASRAFTLIPGGALMAHAFGIFLILGGGLVVLAILKSDVSIETIGLACISAGAAVYSFGVYIGLGVNGLIAGTLSLLLALGSLLRISFLLGLAKSMKE